MGDVIKGAIGIAAPRTHQAEENQGADARGVVHISELRANRRRRDFFSGVPTVQVEDLMTEMEAVCRSHEGQKNKLMADIWKACTGLREMGEAKAASGQLRHFAWLLDQPGE